MMLSARIRFEPTYKELKHILTPPAKLTVSECFEPTYKELKPVAPWLPFYHLLCFEPTYKELKLLDKKIAPLNTN